MPFSKPNLLDTINIKYDILIGYMKHTLIKETRIEVFKYL